MHRYFIYMAYNGTRYCGWQRQPNGVSIQQCIEEALSTVLRRSITITGAGRTDAGVHARCMAAHFDVTEKIEQPSLLMDKLNKILSRDIAILKIVPVTNDAHARFDALARTYIYMLSEKKDPFRNEFMYRTSLRGVDFDKMNEACAVLFEYTDFTSFSKLHTDVKTHLCRIDTAQWVKTDEVWTFTIKADRFLRNMVRAIVGTMLAIGRGKLTINDFRLIIEAKDRCKAGDSVSPEGLALTEIEYPNHLFLDY